MFSAVPRWPSCAKPALLCPRRDSLRSLIGTAGTVAGMAIGSVVSGTCSWWAERGIRRSTAVAAARAGAVRARGRPLRPEEDAAVTPLLDAFFEGLGPKAVEVLSANLDRAGARLVRLVEQEQRRFMAKPTFHEVVELKKFDPVRATDRKVSGDRFGSFSKSAAYDDWQRSLFQLEWFDSRPERTAANMLDASDNVFCWVRLYTGCR